LHESIALAQKIGDRYEMAHSLVDLGAVYTSLGRFEEAQLVLEESLATSKSLGDQRGIISSSVRLGVVRMHLGLYEETKKQARESTRLARMAGHREDILLSLLLSSGVALARESTIEAQALLDEAAAGLDKIRQRDDWGWGMALLIIAACQLGRSDQACKLLVRLLQVASDEAIPVCWIFSSAALYLAKQGQYERAVEMYALLSGDLFVAGSEWFAWVVGQHIATVAKDLSPTVAGAAEERGRIRDLQSTIAELLAELR
jgi:tetratricopeptide (TPR) repeat protein